MGTIVFAVVWCPELFTSRWQQGDVSHKYSYCLSLDKRGDTVLDTWNWVAYQSWRQETSHGKAMVKPFCGFLALAGCWPASALQVLPIIQWCPFTWQFFKSISFGRKIRAGRAFALRSLNCYILHFSSRKYFTLFLELIFLAINVS